MHSKIDIIFKQLFQKLDSLMSIAAVNPMKRYLLIVLGNFMITLGLGQVVLANGFVAGGVTGMGLILHHFLPVDVAILTGILNSLLFVLGALFLGRQFAISTGLSAVLFPIFLKVCVSICLFPELSQDYLLAAILGAALIGGGIGLIIRNNGSTGGVDVIALLMHKYLHLPISKLLAAIDLTIIGLQLIWEQNSGVLYGLLVVVLTSVILNQTLIYGNGKVQVLIISQAHEAIREAILFQCDTGVTLLHIETGYDRHQQEALMTIVPYKNLVLVKETIKALDSSAFVIVSTVQEVNGRGYSMER